MEIIGRHYRTGRCISVQTDEGRISTITLVPDATHSKLPIIGPGLVDLQVNGYLGMDFNAPGLNEDTISRITRTFFQEGVTTFFPTVITNSPEAIDFELRQIASCRATDEIVSQCVPGIHLEGPFISPEDGARGAHDSAYVTAPDWALFQQWQEAAAGMIRIVTLSPEWPEALDFITRSVESGVTVSIGHTAASPERIREAVSAGATMSTHLGNGSHAMIPRHHNYIWEQLAEDDLWACFIGDGFHLPPSFLKVALRAKQDKAMLVSDVVSMCGMKPGEYETTVGKRVVLTEEGKLHIEGNDKILAGSAQALPWGISHLVRTNLVTLADAWEMSSMRPATMMNLPAKKGLAVGAPADVVLFDWDGQSVRVLQTFKNGRLVYER